jgi:predicted DsbA family dithiol-disulfide isomerase
MNEKLKIDIISDVVCPWCIIGYNNLAAAIVELGLQDRAYPKQVLNMVLILTFLMV